MPYQTENVEIDLNHNVWDLYQALIRVEAVSLETSPNRLLIDRTKDQWTSWEEWCEKVVWWGHKKGAFLYKCTTITDRVPVPD